MTCYCGALDCPSCGPAQGAGYAPDPDDGNDDNAEAEAEAEDRAERIKDAMADRSDELPLRYR